MFFFSTSFVLTGRSGNKRMVKDVEISMMKGTLKFVVKLVRKILYWDVLFG